MAAQIFPYGTALTVVWHLSKPDGTDFDITGYTYRVYYRTGNKETEANGSHVTASANTISIVIPATEPSAPGEYALRLVLYQNNKLFCTLNYNGAFVLSRRLAQDLAMETQQEEVQIVHLYTVAEFYLFTPIIPTVGSDGYWYVNGTKVTDGHGEFVPSSHTMEYDAQTNYIIIDRDRVDSQGHSIAQTITSLADALITAAEDHETAQEDHSTAAGDHQTAAADHSAATWDHQAIVDMIDLYEPITIYGDVTNAPDEEDITSDENDLLKFKDRGVIYGMGYCILRRNKTFAEQVTKTNTIYEIRYDFDLDGETVSLPEGCVFKFVGGQVSNGSLSGDFSTNAWHFNDVEVIGSVEFTCEIPVPTENAKEFVETILEHKAVTSVEPTIFNFSAGERYMWDGVLKINRKNVTLTGGGTIEGTLHLGLDAEDFLNLHYDAYPTTAHFNIIVSNLRFSKYSVIGSYDDSTAIRNYIMTASPDDADNISISVVNVCHVKIANCFFDNVPYPIVYTPNSTYVNQNVRRLNVVNCDFEYCNIGILAPSIVESSTEYGDLLVANCNFFCYSRGIKCSCIDGFKVFNNVFNTTTRGYNIEAKYPGQFVITGNSFYGENNKASLLLDNVGKAVIVGNLFSSQSNSEGIYPTDLDSVACVIIKRTDTTTYTESLTIVGNQFSKVNKEMMIFFNGLFRGLSVTGNSVALNTNADSRRILYNVKADSTATTEMQPFIWPANFKSVGDHLQLKMEVIHDYLLGNLLYLDTRLPKTKRYYAYDREGTVTSLVEYKPIFVVSFSSAAASSSSSEVVFYFNGVRYAITDVSSSSSASVVLGKVINALTGDWASSYNFSIIGSLLWIVGKAASAPVYAPFHTYSTTSSQVLQCVYQNLGYRHIFKDVDGKNYITLPINNNYSGIDSSDNGKKLVLNGKEFTLQATTIEDAHGTLYYRDLTTPVPSLRYVIFSNDTFFGAGEGCTDSADTIVSAIVTFAYSDIYSVGENNTIVVTEAGVEFRPYHYNGWYWTWRNHVASIKLLTPEGLEYDSASDTYNNSGATASRPTDVKTGFIYFDETLGKGIVWNGSAWINLDGPALS